MNWKVRLDRYLTSPPDDDYDRWSSAVMEAHDQEFYEANCPWLGSHSTTDGFQNVSTRRILNPKPLLNLSKGHTDSLRYLDP